MGRMYSVGFTASAQTAAIEFFEVVTPATCSVVIHSLEIGQTTELGDAMEEQLEWYISSGATVSGNGSATTPVALDRGITMAALSTCETVATTKANTGTIVYPKRGVFNVRAGLLYVPTPETRISIPPSTRLTVGLTAAPADSVTWVGCLEFEEV